MDACNQKTVVDIGPECLAVNSDAIRNKILDTLATKQTDICLDFMHTKFIDAAGVGAIASTIFEGRRRGVIFTMRGAAGSVLEMLAITGMDRVLVNESVAGQG